MVIKFFKKLLLKKNKKLLSNFIKLFAIIFLLAIIVFMFIFSKTFSELISSEEYEKYDIWDGTSVASSFSGGNGTKDNPYQISSGSELMYFKNLIEGSSSSSYNTLYYKLTNNINLDGNDIQSIGIPVSISNYDNNTNIFKGTFDGNGYVIANGIFTTRNSSSNDYYGGLFAMTNNANITNLVLAKITITLSNVSNYNNIYIGTLAGAVLSKTNSIIQNCSIYDTTINITNNANIGGLIGYQDINSTLNGIYVNATITSSSSINKGNIVGYNNSTLDDNIKNSVIYSNSLENIYGYSALPSNFSSVYLYSYSTTFIIKKFEYNESLILSNSNKTEYDLASLLTANCNEKFNWVVYNDYIRFNNETTINKDDILINYSDSIFVSKLSTNNTGIVGNVVYLNDIKKDYYYYMGLNYTTSDDGYMPSNENKKIYNNNNLVAVKLSYYGKNKENTLQGYVSTTEQQDTYIYYKLYNVNNNNTASLSDDYITIELSDNIFTDRPENKAFNGWITDYNGAKIYYDSTTYTRYVDVPITYSSSIPNTINLDMYSTWIDATISYVNSSSTWATAFSSLKSAGMQAITAYTYTYLPYDMSGYYLPVTVSRGASRVGYYSNRGVLYTSGTCTSTTCTYYDLISNENYNSELTYYYLNSSSTMTVLNPDTLNRQVDQQILNPALSGSVSGLYKSVTLNRYDSLVGYYDNLGNLQKSGTCSSTTCTYYELIQYYDNYNQNLFNESYNYYYLVTRDINIVIMNGSISNTWASTQNKPFTLTSVYNDTDYRSSVTWTVSSAAVRCYADTVIENIKIYSTITKTTGAYNPPSGSSSGNLYGNWFNLKVGRGITQYSTNYTNFASVMGGYASSVGSSSSVKKYKLIIESGVYNATSLSTGIVSTSYTMYIENKSIYGSDYDKAINNNSNLQVIYCASGSWGGIFYGATTTSNIFDLTVKSGSYGTNKYDYTTGIYVGGRYGGTHNAARKIVYEGGYSYNLIGGPLTNSNRTLYNDSYIYMTGGTVDMITAGAGSTATYGNRIVQVTGGLISYSIFGGSNGYQGTSGDGTVNGSSLVFVGGNATIGEESLIASSSSLYGATAGNVFGIGNGNSSYSTIGSNDNATVVIANEASVNRDVYGGGNYGTLGISSSYNTMEATIKIVGGTINGSIYGGGNNSGAGSTTKTATINIDVIKGTINGSIYGGSNAKGIVYGDSKLNIVSGTINGSIYGGGKGGYTSSSSPGTFVAGNIVLNLGSRNYGINPTILGTVYGGSAYGTVNGSTNTTAKSSKYVTVNYYTGNVGTIYGGGEGNTTYTPYVEGNISVNVYGGKITNLYGGNNASGTPNGDINLNLNGGIITNAYGGGNAATTKVNNVNLNGSIITNLYGGGNQAGATTSNIDAKSGSVSNLFGGSNQSGVVQTSNISANEISKDISSRLNMDVTYTGNNISEWETVDYLAYETLNVNITNSSDTEVTTWSATIVTSDSRLNTNYSSTNIDSNNGVYIFNQENRYWGTNTIPANGNYSFQFGVVSYVPFEEFKIIAVTITGYNSSGVAFTTTLSGLDITNLYGGNNAGGTTTNNNINLNNMTLTNLYGGGNNANVTQDVNLSLNNVIVRGSIYGGGNNGNVSNTNVTIEKSTISGSIYGGGNNGDVLNDASLILKTTSVSSSVYGGGNQGDINGSTNVEVENAIILESIYSGCNAAIVYGNTDILIAGETKISQSVFGGGNSGSVGDNSLNNSTSTVNIIGGVITGNVYGGCNTSVIYGQTLVNIGSSYTTNEYARGTIKISGTVFGGGEANASGSEIYDFSFISVTNGITIDINGSDYTSETLILEGSVFGSGNASSSSGTSIININDLGTKADPNRCISIQRANNVTISNSVIELVGTTDRTNEYSALKYSLNRIDLLKIKNNTTLLLQQNANLLKELQSLVDINNEEVLSEATIDENHNVTRNTNNRIYLLTNKNLNVTTNESATAYGKISGMIFLGMYNSYTNGEYSYGIYGLESNDESDAGDVITGGSYILGLHPANYDTTKNGFYTNYITEDYTKVEASYIEPTPDSANYYIWAIGVESINYSFALTASKYSSLGTYQLSLIDFAEGNTTFEVLGFNAEGLSEDIDLVDVNNVPKIGSTYEANTIFGLSMKAETTEWTSNDTTKFLSSSNGIYTGATSYLTDNQAAAPTLTFYLYHAKNIDLNANLGSVTVVLQALIPINEIEYDIKLITITIDLTARTYSDDPAYDASITYGKKYEMPSITDVNITNDSSFTTYFSLYADADNMNDIYGLSNNYYHTLSSDFALPVGTKITMLDLGADANSPKYYYYIVNSTDYAQSLIKLANDNEATYNLSKFVAMDSVTATNKYDDYSQNQLYYHDDIDLVVEEFIFIFDFEDTQMTSNQLNNSILLELRTPEDRTSISVLGIRQESLIYNLYEKTNVVLNADIDYGDNYLYYDINKTILYNINIGYDKTSNLQSIIDTNYESNSMGLNITLIDNSGTEVSSSQLVGTSIKMGTSIYYASSDGVFRIKLSNKVSNLTKSFILSVSKNLPSGNYTMKIELFASDDGLHKDKVDNTANIAFTLVGSNNSIESVMVDNEKIIDGVTGNHLNNNNLITTTINYQSVLTKPNIRVAVYKRDNTTYLSNTYNEIDFKSITSTTLTYPAVYSLTSKSEYEYMVSNNPQSINTFIYRLKTNLASGTYKIEYRLYDSNQLIETDTEYLIVKKSLIS